jgi:hypothetical protein
MMPGLAAGSLPPKSPAAIVSAAPAKIAGLPLLPVPAGFNPIAATATQLAEYGFPPKPTGNAAAIAEWTYVMEHSKQEAPLRTYASNSTSSLTPEASGQQQGNWAGYDVQSNQKLGIHLPTLQDSLSCPAFLQTNITHLTA